MKNLLNRLRQALAKVKNKCLRLVALVYRILNWIPADKQLHMLWPFFIADWGKNVWNIETGISLAMGFVIGKEVLDKLSKRGNPEIVDLVMGMVGVGFRLIMHYAFD